jgi:hypothetical protein
MSVWCNRAMIPSLLVADSHHRRISFAKSWTTSASRTLTILVVRGARHQSVDVDALVVAS